MEVGYGDMDGEDRDLELIEEYGIDIEELEQDLGRLNIIPGLADRFNVDSDELSSDGDDSFIVDDFGGDPEMLLEHQRFAREMSTFTHLSKTSAEVFTEVKDQVLMESPTLRLCLAVEKGNFDAVKEELKNGAEIFVGGPQNVLRRRLTRLSTSKMYSYQNIEEKNDKTSDNLDKICVMLMEEHPELIDFDVLILMVNNELFSLITHTLEYLDERQLHQKLFNQSRSEFLNALFQDTFIEKAVTNGSMPFLPIFKKMNIDLNARYQTIMPNSQDLSITIVDKFMQNLLFKLERSFGWSNDYHGQPLRERLLDKTLGRLQHTYSITLANMCDYGVDIDHELAFLDMSDWGELDKTLVNYLVITLKVLEKSIRADDSHRQDAAAKAAERILSECLVVIANKRISLFTTMSNSMITEFMSLESFRKIQWRRQRELLLELTQRRQKAKAAEDAEWLFQQSLLDSKGRRAFSVRGRGRKTNTKC